jgi:hypothetical protein
LTRRLLRRLIDKKSSSSTGSTQAGRSTSYFYCLLFQLA